MQQVKDFVHGCYIQEKVKARMLAARVNMLKASYEGVKHVFENNQEFVRVARERAGGAYIAFNNQMNNQMNVDHRDVWNEAIEASSVGDVASSPVRNVFMISDDEDGFAVVDDDDDDDLSE